MGEGRQSGFEMSPPDSNPALLIPIQHTLSSAPARNQNQRQLYAAAPSRLSGSPRRSPSPSKGSRGGCLMLPWPQQAARSAKRSGALEKRRPHRPLYPWGACSPPRTYGNRRKVLGSGQPSPRVTHGETEAQRDKGTYLLQANRMSDRAGPQPLRLSSLPQGWKTRLRPDKAGLPSPLSSSGPSSRHLGDSPEFIDRQDSLESIWCTLLINLFQIIAENYWFV